MPKDNDTGVAVKSDRHANWFGQRSYHFETHDSNGNLVSVETKDAWKNRVIEEIATPANMIAKGILRIYLIFHDKDVDEHGNNKDLHCHFVVRFKDSDVWERIHKKLGCSDRESNCQPPADVVNALRYLIHVSADALNSDKYIYNADDVIAVSADPTNYAILPYRKAIQESARKQEKRKKENENEKKEKLKGAMSVMLESVATGSLTLSTVRNMYKTDYLKVGLKLSDWYTHKKRYEEAEQEYFNAVLDFYSVNPRCLTTVYISGSGGSGKSELGLSLAHACFPNCPIHRPATHGEQTTFDFAGDYHGEPVTLFNEFSACFPVDQFNDIFDPIHANRVNSRNKDKPWFAELAILPTSDNIEQTIYNMWYDYAEKELSKLGCKLPYAHSKQQQLINMEMANADVADKIRQIRRRLHVFVQLTAQSTAEVYFMSYANNVPHIYLYDTPQPNTSPYLHFASCPYDVNDPIKMNQTVETIKKAIVAYYDYNKHIIRPETVQRPVIVV